MNLPRLTAIIDADVTAARGWTVPDAARACLDGGARLIQVRGKGASSRVLLAWCDAIAAAAAPFGAAIIVNDRSDVARMAGAAGVHLGQDDLAPAAARAILGDAAVVGLSTHTPEQVRAACQEPISYLAMGPVFGSRTKDTGYEAVGLALVRSAVAATAGRIPVVAIGGITLERAAGVLAAGASSVAVISDLFATDDPERRTRQYLEILEAAGRDDQLL